MTAKAGKTLLLLLAVCVVLAGIVASAAQAAPNTGTGPISILSVDASISGDCGSSRTVTVVGDVNRGFAIANSHQGRFLLETTVSYSQGDTLIGTFSNSDLVPAAQGGGGDRIPYSMTLAVPQAAAGLVEVRAVTNLLRQGPNRGTVIGSATMTEVIDFPLDPLEAIKRNLHLGALQADSSVYNRGELVNLSWSLKNESADPLCVPPHIFFPQFHTVGVFQKWIKRLGPDSEIPSIPPIIVRDADGRYAAGGAVIATEGFLADPALWPAQFEQAFSDSVPFYPTDDFPPGQYRFYVELKSRDLNEVLASVSVDVEFQ